MIAGLHVGVLGKGAPVYSLGVHSSVLTTIAAGFSPSTRHFDTCGTYSPYSKRAGEILRRYSPTVRAASIDEYFVDFAGCERLYRKPSDVDGDATIRRVVEEIRAAIRDEVGLPASAGIGTSRTIAKIASGRAKPDGCVMVLAGHERRFLQPLPVRKFPGIGPVAEGRLHAAGIHTLGELIGLVQTRRARQFTGLAERVRRVVAADQMQTWSGERPAFREHDLEGVAIGSISNERTFMSDVGDDRRVRDQLRSLCERVCWRVRRRKVHARTITLKLRYADFQTLTRARTIPATDAEKEVMRCITALYEKAHTRDVPIRLLGVALSNLVSANRQLNLPFDGRNRPRIGSAIDKVREQFGYDAIKLGAVDGESRWLA